MTTYNETMDGGAVVSAKMLWRQFDAWRNCPCAAFAETMTGGAKGGGDAVPILDTVEGGATASGDALVSVNTIYDGLGGVWVLDEAYPPYRDRTGWQLDGTASNVPDLDDGAGCSLSQHFSGSESIALPADSVSLDAGFSVTCLARIDDNYANRAFFSRGNFVLGRHYHGGLFASVVGASGKTYTAWGNTKLQHDQWYHCAATWAPNDALRVYLDGVLQATIATPENSLGAVSGCAIGSHASGSWLRGNAQEVRLYARTLDAVYLRAERDCLCSPGFSTLTIVG